METVEVPVKVAKESYELGLALGKIVIGVKSSLKDGFQSSDLPVILAALMSKDVVDGLMGVEKIGAEIKDDKAAFINAVVVAAAKIVDDLK